MLLLAVTGAGSAAAASGSGSAVQGARAFAFLNQQRQANGIPPLTTLTQKFSTAWCPDEDNGPSGGELFRDWSSATFWTATSSPWDAAPLHQQSLYEPAYTGFGDSIGGSPAASCAGLGGYQSPWQSPTFFAFTSAQGRAQTPVSETVIGEGPFAPQQKVGIREGVTTGPNIIVYAEGFTGEGQWAADPASTQPEIVSVSLLGPTGPVKQVLFVNAGKLAGLAAPGVAFVIPCLPLAPATTYRATVVWHVASSGQQATQTFSFKTVRAGA